MTDHCNAVQKALFQRLTAAAICDGRIFDKPAQGVSYPFVSFGPADQVDDGAECIDGTVVTQQLDVWSEAQDGFKEAKDIAGAIRLLLHRQDIQLEGVALAEIEVRTIRHLADRDDETVHSAIEVRVLVETV